MLISVFSPKGGIGKTTLTLALANAFSKQVEIDNFKYNFRTCVVEFDFSPGDFASILNLDNSKNIINAIRYGLKENIQTSGDFDVILGGYPDAHELIGQNDFYRLVKKLEKNYDVVIVDIQPGFIERSIDVINYSDVVLLVAEDTLSIAARINGFLDWYESNNLGDTKNFCYLVNRVIDKEFQFLDKINYKLPILHSVPYIKRISGYSDKRIKNHAIAIRDAILERNHKKYSINKEKPKKKKKEGLLKRIFKGRWPFNGFGKKNKGNE